MFMIRPGSNGSGNMTRARLIERVFRRRLTVLLALGALWGCTMEEQGVQTPAVSPTGAGGAVSPAGGSAASGGGSGSGVASGGASGNSGALASAAGTASGSASAGGGASGATAAAGSSGTSASAGTSGTDAAAGSGGNSGTDAATGSAGTSTSGGTSGTDAAAGSGGNSGTDAAAGSGGNSGADTTKWNIATSEPYTVNGEQQKYTARPQNVFHDGQGHLVLRGLHDYWNSNGAVYPYTSARLQSDGKFQFSFGRIEVRAKLPAGQGSFPAILLMGTTGNWPQCGEIGMMEQWGQDKSWLYCSTYSGASSDVKQQVPFPNATTLSSDFHVYALEWYSDHMVFFIDDAQVARSNFAASSPFFTGTYYLILDVAIGGTMGGAIDDAGGFPMDMVLDYVRVYSQ